MIKPILKKCSDITGLDKEYFRRRYIKYRTRKVESDYLVLAMQRSGHHAVINWIRGMLDNSTLYNNCNKQGIPYDIDGNPKGKNIFRNYENFLPENCRNKLPKKNSILVIRDPWNQFCSYRKKCLNDLSKKNKTLTPPLFSYSDIPILQNLWKSHAKEGLGLTNNLNNRILIIYDNWFDDAEYRRDKAGELGLNFNDSGKKIISNYGGGPSFEGSKKAEHLHVKQRWNNCVEDDLYKKLFEDKELTELADICGFNNKLGW